MHVGAELVPVPDHDLAAVGRLGLLVQLVEDAVDRRPVVLVEVLAARDDAQLRPRRTRPAPRSPDWAAVRGQVVRRPAGRSRPAARPRSACERATRPPKPPTASACRPRLGALLSPRCGPVRILRPPICILHDTVLSVSPHDVVRHTTGAQMRRRMWPRPSSPPSKAWSRTTPPTKGWHRAVDGVALRRRGGPFLHAARALRLRQDDDPALRRRPRAPGRAARSRSAADVSSAGRGVSCRPSGATSAWSSRATRSGRT